MKSFAVTFTVILGQIILPRISLASESFRLKDLNCLISSGGSVTEEQVLKAIPRFLKEIPAKYFTYVAEAKGGGLELNLDQDWSEFPEADVADLENYVIDAYDIPASYVEKVPQFKIKTRAGDVVHSRDLKAFANEAYFILLAKAKKGNQFQA
jgi:hypothetical protein